MDGEHVVPELDNETRDWCAEFARRTQLFEATSSPYTLSALMVITDARGRRHVL